MSDAPVSSGPSKRPIGERKLAAVVFTDVVGFSARVQENEALTLRLATRDFALMSDACSAGGGQVLKSTGDGLLMWFPTASAAVGWALKIQKHLAEAAKSLPPQQVLQHRIGIHLGDVFVTAGDVMGNDVNIAARVLSEAGGGEICVSQTVYDVVKHRLSVKGVYLGERELKNIAEPVPIFRLPVTGEQLGATDGRALPNRALKVVLLVTLPVLVIGGIVFLMWRMKATAAGAPDENVVAPATQPASRPAVEASVQLIDVTRTGGGAWKGRYGSCGAVVFGDEPPLLPEHATPVPLSDSPTPAEVTISQCALATLPRPAGRGPDAPAPQRVKSEERVIGAILTRDTMSLHVRLPDAKPRRMTLYFWDWHEGGRAESVTIRNAADGEILLSKAILGFRDGQYVTFLVRGEFDVQIKNEKGPNALLSAIFFDPRGNLPATLPAEELRRSGGRKPQPPGAGGRRR